MVNTGAYYIVCRSAGREQLASARRQLKQSQILTIIIAIKYACEKETMLMDH